MIYLKISLFVLIFNALTQNSKSSKILAIYPMPSLSHQIVFRKLTLELVKQGHEVTVVTPDPVYEKNKGPNNLIEIDLHDLAYDTLRIFLSKLNKSEIQQKLSDPKTFSTFYRKICEILLQQPNVKEILQKNNTFDVVLIEEIARPFLGISHNLDAPIILFSSFGGHIENLKMFGLQTHPILYPSPLNRPFYNLSTWEKIKKIYVYLGQLYSKYLEEDEDFKIIQKYFGPEISSVRQLYENVHMLFLNIHPIWTDNQPVPTNVIYLGGLHQLEENKELPMDLQIFLNSSRHGVIYVSFGTNALSNLLPGDKVEIMTKVLGQLPYDVLWKWDADELPGRKNNIKLYKWLPQADLLRHPKIKLFITQGGLQSIDEAITAGVPLLVFPVLGDQWYNAEKCVRHGIGEKILFEEVTEDALSKSIEKVISDESYRKNIIRLRDVMQDRPLPPLDVAMYWINHLIRHKGGKHLRAAGANLTWSEYYEIEVVFILLTLLVLMTVISFSVIYIRYSRGSEHYKSKQN